LAVFQLSLGISKRNFTNILCAYDVFISISLGQTDIEPMSLGKVYLDLVNSFKYLGILFNSDSTLKADINHIKRKFYTACNGILSHCSCADEFVRLELVKVYCLPLLTL